MKITGPSAPSLPSARAASRAGSSGFTVAGGGSTPSAAAPAAATAASGVAGLSSLMALQGVEDATERRRRAVRRGNGLLDRLSDLKLALLSGDGGERALEGLTRTLREERSEDDPGLKAVIDQIDLRAAVELAKADLRRSAT